MEQLIYEILGKKYLLVEYPIVIGRQAKVERLIKKYDCIAQGVKDINRGGFFSEGHCIYKILVPEQNIIAFNAEG